MPAKIVAITTDGEGDGSNDFRLYGVVHAIAIRQATLTDGFNVTFSDAATGLEILALEGVTEDGVKLPRVAVQDAAGDDIADAYDKPPVTGAIRITVASGGAVKTGEFVILYG